MLMTHSSDTQTKNTMKSRFFRRFRSKLSFRVRKGKLKFAINKRKRFFLFYVIIVNKWRISLGPLGASRDAPKPAESSTRAPRKIFRFPKRKRTPMSAHQRHESEAVRDVTRVRLTEFDGHESQSQAGAFAFYPHWLDGDRWLAVVIQNAFTPDPRQDPPSAMTREFYRVSREILSLLDPERLSCTDERDTNFCRFCLLIDFYGVGWAYTIYLTKQFFSSFFLFRLFCLFFFGVLCHRYFYTRGKREHFPTQDRLGDEKLKNILFGIKLLLGLWTNQH